MAKRQRSKRRASVAEQVSPGDHGVRLADLARSFATFRRGSRPGARIPDTLRQGAIVALRSGVTAQQLRQRCGVTKSQVASWGRGKRRDSGAGKPERISARTFAVLDDEHGPSWSMREPSGPMPVALEVGGWSIRIAPRDA